jgi:hypothetical protein
MELINAPAEELSLVERWIYYKQAEKEAQNEIEKIKKKALVEVEDNGGFFTGSNGKAQRISKTTRKAKESLKTLLAEQGVLELCQKDDIDLKKVQDMIDSNTLNSEEVEVHIETKDSPYLKLGK